MLTRASLTIRLHPDDDVVIASSSSALLVSDMQANCARPRRIGVGQGRWRATWRIGATRRMRR